MCEWATGVSMSSSQPIERYLDGTSGKPLPWLYWLAAEVESVPPDEFDADPDTLERTLRSAADLFDLPALTIPFDSTVLAEAMGCEIEWSADGPAVSSGCVATVDDAFDLPIEAVADDGRVPTTVEAVSRLTETVSERAVVAVVPGPSHLTTLLTEPDPPSEVATETRWSAGDAVVEAARSYLDAGADALAVLEPAGVDPALADVLDPVRNVVEYYGARSILATRTLEATAVETADDVGFDAITGRPASDDGEPGGSIAVGYGEPIEAILDGRARSDPPEGYDFLTCQWELPRETPIERVHQFVGSG
jgi:hypothetical protein